MSGRLQRGVAVAAALVLLVARWAWTILRPAGQYRVTAYFTQTVGLYPGSDVRILGIAVGTITDVVPEGDRVRVSMLDRRQLRRPGRRRRRRPGAVAGVRPVRAVRAGLRRRRQDEGRRHGAAASAPRPRSSSTRSTARSTTCRPALGPERREQERRAVRPRRRRGGEPRRATARQLNHTLTGLLPGGADARRAPRRPVLLAGQPADLHQRAGLDRRAGRPVQHQPRGGRRSSWPASGRTWPPAIALLSKALGDVSDVRAHNTTLLTTQRQPAGRRHARPGAAARGAGAGARRRPGGAGATSRTPTTPTTARSTPATTRPARPAPRSSSARCSPRPGRVQRRQPAGPASPPRCRSRCRRRRGHLRAAALR